ncbi:hypothetical protein [Pandoraea sp. PE-S2T-3]|uniref:hypothetical protein n=1 Tax=Pandoraea sp. PE-S2T-3 TaxID=1986993 RepID=UPI000B3F8A81|nr:hypothetical protein [Pandoraea sp. PE-S2T-3]
MIDVAPGSAFRFRLKWGHWLCYAIIAVYSCFLWGPLTHAKWGAIDDHEIMWMIGQHPRLPPSQIGQVLANTELAPDAKLARFRPSYYVIRAAEAMAWGKQPALWYGIRILIALLTGLTLALLCLPFAGPVLSAGFAIFVLSAPYWGDIFARAGPAETYAVFGLCVMALSWALRSRRTLGFAASVGVSIGIVIAAGSKENMLVLAAIPVLLLIWRKRLRVTPWACLPLMASLTFMSWIALTVMSRLRNAGADIYSNDVSMHSRLELLLSIAGRPVVWIWVFALATGLLAWRFMDIRLARYDDRTRDMSSLVTSLKRFSIGGIALFAVYASQIVFYSKAWPDDVGLPGRYLLPGVLSAQLQLLFGAVLLVDVIRVVTRRSAYAPIITAGTATLLCAAFLFSASDHFAANRATSVHTLSETQKFSANLDRLKAMLHEDRMRPLILNIHSLWDIEPVVSVYRYLRADGIPNPIALRTTALEPERFINPFEMTLAKQLQAMVGGTSDMIDTTALDHVSQQDCYSVGMHGPSLTTCRDGFAIWPN